MRTKNHPWIWLALSVLALLYWWAGRETEDKNLEDFSEPAMEQAAEPVVEEAPKALEEPVIKATLTKPVALVSGAPNKLEGKVQQVTRVGRVRQIPKGMVEFELKGDHMAVAFGDIVLGQLQSAIKGKRGVYKPKKAGLWDSSVIPYAIHQDVAQRGLIEEAIQYFNENSAIEFVPLNGEPDAIVFVSWEQECASYLGKVGGHQPIYVGPECGVEQITHELMHALGFVHEHSRVDRDKYVKINWQNIKEGFVNQFDVVPDELVHSYTGAVFNFDYKSVMLYRPQSFAKSLGLKTIETVTSHNIEPASHGLSNIDLERLEFLYGR